MKADAGNTPEAEAGSTIRRMPPPWTLGEARPQPGRRVRTWQDLLRIGQAPAPRSPFQPPRPPSSRKALDASRRWAWQNRYEILAVAVITGVGAFLRLYRLDGIPAGMHGDEALNALRAHAILDREWAGPYDPYHANGQPAGIEFWLAGLIALFGDSPFVLRLSTASLSIATLPLAYLLFRAIDGRSTATIGAGFLALSSWHLVFSRIAMSSVMPVITEVLAALAIVLTMRHRKWWLFPLAGVAIGLGLYTNNTYPYFLAAVAAVLAGWLVAQRAALRPALLGLAALTVAFLITSLPMVRYVLAHHDTYFRYARSQSIFYSPRFEDASGLAERTDAVLDSGRDFVRLLVFSGSPSLPMLAIPTSILLGIGLLYAARRWREPGIALGVVAILLVPWAAILNPTGDSVMLRRAIGATPFLALVAALPLSAALRHKHSARPYLQSIALLTAVAALVSVGVINARFYFEDYAGAEQTGRGLNLAIRRASDFLDDLTPQPYVYFYSETKPFDYVVRQYLAPHVQGADRSGYWGSEFDLTLDREGDVAYVFLDAFLDRSEEVQQLYPGGRLLESDDEDGTVLFRAYVLSNAEPTSNGPPQATATPTGTAAAATPAATARENEGSAALRDAARRKDLEELRQALDRYAQQEGGYPDTENQLQSLCVYPLLDAGCSLTEVLPDLPTDPLGPSTSNGYWYISDGSSYVLIARQEAAAEESSDCPENVIRAASGEPRYCIVGP